ncbi:MAG: hypothetical protein JNJ53_10825 [Rhizobiales bacterium]|nr:hypothetical protein [Hyphomicrobiales bacterium]
MIETIVPFLWSTLKLVADPRAWLIAAVVFAVGWFKGSAHTERKWQALIIAERAEQDRKIKKSDERAFVAIDRLNAEMEKRNALIAQLEELAKRDPAAKHLCLSADSVRRINRARSR